MRPKATELVERLETVAGRPAMGWGLGGAAKNPKEEVNKHKLEMYALQVGSIHSSVGALRFRNV